VELPLRNNLLKKIGTPFYGAREAGPDRIDAMTEPDSKD
jgi:hypothetical protein